MLMLVNILLFLGVPSMYAMINYLNSKHKNLKKKK